MWLVRKVRTTEKEGDSDVRDTSRRCLRQLDAELFQLAVDAWRSPERIRLADLTNQCLDVPCQRRPTDAAGSRLPAPIRSERAPMPTDDGGGRHDLHGSAPVSARGLRATPRPADRADEGAVVLGWLVGVRRVDAAARILPPR